MEVVDTPAIIPPNVENVFRGYSFISPSILFADNNVISDDMFRPNPDKKPSTSNLVGCILKVDDSQSIKIYFKKKLGNYKPSFVHDRNLRSSKPMKLTSVINFWVMEAIRFVDGVSTGNLVRSLLSK